VGDNSEGKAVATEEGDKVGGTTVAPVAVVLAGGAMITGDGVGETCSEPSSTTSVSVPVM
jgi:hypothetical protein